MARRLESNDAPHAGTDVRSMTPDKYFQLATLERWFGQSFDEAMIIAFLEDRITLRELVCRWVHESPRGRSA
jgi:hypothetical protein